MRVVVTGAGGLVGRAMVRHYGAVPLLHRDLDITDRAAVLRKVTELRPDLIVNCAVLGVDQCEEDPAAAKAINIDGPSALADAAERTEAMMVHFSSNYVFEGNEEHCYAPSDEPRPINEYGRTKLAGEREVAARCSRAMVVRSSWIFGPGKESFISTVHRQLRAGRRVRAVADIWASATYVDDLAGRVADLVGATQYGLHHVVNDGVCSNETFAQEAARIVGADPALIEPVSTRKAHRAPRPRYTPLLALPPLRDWRQALRAYIDAWS